MNITALLAGLMCIVSILFAKNNLEIYIFFVLANLWLMLSCYFTQIKIDKTNTTKHKQCII